jgi:HTH-type transcriptional regulator, sugar sensing transcriptional regulator
MKKKHLASLEKFGLSIAEAQIYLSLSRFGAPMRASAIVAATDVPRGSIYPALSSLVQRGIVENGEGYGSQFSAVPAEEALSRLIAAEKEKLSEAESLKDDLIKAIESRANERQSVSEANLVEVIRDPRVCGNRLQKLQQEVESEVNALVKAPLILRSMTRNPGEAASLRRGVRHRAIYESAVVEHEDVAPHLATWIKAGEEAREYQGDLPFKLALFDAKIAWVPLVTNAPRHPVVSVLIRHPALGKALRLLFDYLWKESKPIKLGAKRARKRPPNGARAPSKK